MHSEKDKDSYKTAELLVFVEKMRTSLLTWKFLTFLAIFLVLIVLVAVGKGKKGDGKFSKLASGESYIAKVTIDNIIVSDKHVEKTLSEMIKDKQVKAVIIELDSPGGTLGGSEIMYNIFSKIRKANKPIVAVMKDIAASGAYMIATASDHILLQRSTITGSIGVIAQSAEFVDLANKVGVKFNTFKSSQLKGVPSPTEKLSPVGTAFLNEMVAESFTLFKDIVMERRGKKLDKNSLDKIFDGRIFLGQTAIKLGLADAIGDEEDASNWLKKKLKNNSLTVVDISLEKKEKFKLSEFIGQAAGKLFGIAGQTSVEQQFQYVPMAILR